MFRFLILFKARQDEKINDLISSLTSIMRSQLKHKKGNFLFKVWFPETESQCTTNELRWLPN